MRTSIECLPCFVKQALDSAKLIVKDEKKIIEIGKKALKELSSFDISQTPPEVVSLLHKMIRKELKNEDPYKSLKENSTKKALEIMPLAKKIIKQSDDVFLQAVKFSIAGNIMDFGMKAKWDEKIISNSFENAKHKKLQTKVFEALRKELDSAKNILILGDNAGEVVFDKILIENLPNKNSKVFYAVKSSPVINDVTKKDAKDAKIDEVAKIIENGTDIPGTALSKCSKEFLSYFDKANVIIAKGQGNFETLNESKKRVYFLFQVKCKVIAKAYGYSPKSWIVTRCDEKNFKKDL